MNISTKCTPTWSTAPVLCVYVGLHSVQMELMLQSMNTFLKNLYLQIVLRKASCKMNKTLR